MSAAAPVITCPDCKKRFKGKPELVGKKIKCPGCSKAFVVPPSEEEPKEELTADEPVASPPQSERRASVPAVGECWKPKDPRRIASFTVKEVIPEQDLVITDDNRKSSSPGSNGTCES